MKNIGSTSVVLLFSAGLLWLWGRRKSQAAPVILPTDIAARAIVLKTAQEFQSLGIPAADAVKLEQALQGPVTMAQLEQIVTSPETKAILPQLIQLPQIVAEPVIIVDVLPSSGWYPTVFAGVDPNADF